LRSGTEHWTHRIAVEVRQGTLNSHDRGWDPTQNTDEEEEEEEEEDRAHIKSNNPHLTGGKTSKMKAVCYSCRVSPFVWPRYDGHRWIFTQGPSKSRTLKVLHGLTPCEAEIGFSFSSKNPLCLGLMACGWRSIGAVADMESRGVQLPRSPDGLDGLYPFCTSALSLDSGICLWRDYVDFRVYAKSIGTYRAIRLWCKTNWEWAGWQVSPLDSFCCGDWLSWALLRGWCFLFCGGGFALLFLCVLVWFVWRFSTSKITAFWWWI